MPQSHVAGVFRLHIQTQGDNGVRTGFLYSFSYLYTFQVFFLISILGFNQSI